MQPRERGPYSPIIDRPPLPPLPGGDRIIFWTIVNVEVWDITRPMPRLLLMPPQGQVRFPDVGNWAWHEYGNRVGFWRFYELFERLGIRPSLSINARVCIDYPRIAEATTKAGWEMLGHSYDQQPIHVEHEPEAMIQKTLDSSRNTRGSDRLDGSARASGRPSSHRTGSPLPASNTPANIRTTTNQLGCRPSTGRW